MSLVMLSCAGIAVLAALASLRYLPGRARAGPARRPPATTSWPAGTPR